MTESKPRPAERLRVVKVTQGNRMMVLELLAVTPTDLRGFLLEDVPPFYRRRNAQGNEMLYHVDKRSVSHMDRLHSDSARVGWAGWPRFEWVGEVDLLVAVEEPVNTPGPSGKRAITFGEV